MNTLQMKQHLRDFDWQHLAIFLCLQLLTVTINYFIFKPPWQESVHHHHLFYNKLVSLALILTWLISKNNFIFTNFLILVPHENMVYIRDFHRLLVDATHLTENKGQNLYKVQVLEMIYYIYSLKQIYFLLN